MKFLRAGDDNSAVTTAAYFQGDANLSTRNLATCEGDEPAALLKQVGMADWASALPSPAHPPYFGHLLIAMCVVKLPAAKGSVISTAKRIAECD